jgi:hypothetical protein
MSRLIYGLVQYGQPGFKGHFSRRRKVPKKEVQEAMAAAVERVRIKREQKAKNAK